MRDAVSQPSLDIEESYFSKNTLFFFKNDFLFYYLKLYTPSVPLIWVFEAFFGPPFCSLTKRKEEKDGSSKVGSRGRSGSVCLAAALIWMINSHLNRTALYHLFTDLLILFTEFFLWAYQVDALRGVWRSPQAGLVEAPRSLRPPAWKCLRRFSAPPSVGWPHCSSHDSRPVQSRRFGVANEYLDRNNNVTSLDCWSIKVLPNLTS